MNSSAAASSPPNSATGPSAASRPASAWLLPSLALLFLLSGGAALIYQLLWLRMLGFVFGVTVHAASTVLASFMCGLALGSYLAGRLADRLERPLVWFGAAEALIGAFALGTPVALAVLQQGYMSLYPSLPDSPASITAIRFVMSFAVLIAPTALMGATLPLVLKSSMARTEAFGRSAGILYAANTAGAIGGTLAAGLYLIPVLGMQRTFLLAAAANLAVAVAAVSLGQRWRVRPAAIGGARHETSAGRAMPHAAVSDDAIDGEGARVRRAVLIVFALSGFASLALEVIWFRVNVLVLRPTVYAFAVMLATVLGGIALGSALVAPLLPRRRNWLVVLIALELLIAAAALLSLRGLEGAPPVMAWAEPYLSAVMPPYLIPLVVISVLTVLPVMLLMGAAFPMGLQLWVGGAERTRPETARRVGVFYALNVSGGIAGAIVAGFVMIPLLGSRISLILLAVLIFGSALLLLAVLDAPWWRRAGVVAGAAAVLAVLAAGMPDPFDVFLAQRFPHERIIWREEGVQTTVSVHQLGENEGARRVLYLDGLHQASSVGSMVYVHRRIGHLPMALHPEPRSALVVGLGGGATAGAVSQYPFAAVQVVELSESVVRAAELFSGINYRLLSRPNVRVHIGDGRNHLMLASRRYDVITADIIQPIHAGAGNVYSAAYFQLVRDALQPGGLAAQWVFGTDAEYRLIMRTFLSVFPHATLWAEGSLMIGSLEPLTLRREDVEWKMQVPETRAALADIGIDGFEALLQLYTAGDREMRPFAGIGPLITDDRPMVEYFLSLERRELDRTGLTGDVTEIVR